MQRFERILLVADGAPGEDEATRRALALARDSGAALTVTAVMKAPPKSLDLAATDVSRKELQKVLSEEREARLKRLAADHSAEGVKIETKLLVGAPFVELVREVIRGKHDLVIKAAQEERTTSAMLFGSTDLHLLRKCPCPVWILKSSQRKRYARILAAVDPDPGDKVAQGINRLILDLAVSLAQREKSELDVVHAWTLYGERTLRNRRVLLEAEIQGLAEQVRAAHGAWIRELLAPYPPEERRAQVHLIKGEAGDVIPKVAEERRVDLIVMGTVARTGIPGFLIGNTAERVLARVDCSVLAVKPKGFVTPVTLSDR